MPAVSKKQQNFMQAVANSPEFAKKVGVNQSIGREFTKEKDMKTKKMNMGGRAMADRAGAQAMDPRMAMAMEAQRKRAAMGGMMKGGKVKKMNMGGRAMVDRTGAQAMDPRMQIEMAAQQKRAAMGGMKKGGKVKGYEAGGGVTMTSMKKDKPKKKMTAKEMADAASKMMGKESDAAKIRRVKNRIEAGRAAARIGPLGKTGGSSAPMNAKGKKMMGGGKVKGYKKGGKVSSASKRADGIAQRGHTRGRIV
mgnify:FL=1